MKKLMTLMLGMALVFTTVAVSFAQDTAKKEETSKKKSKKKKSRHPQELGWPLSGYSYDILLGSRVARSAARPSSVFLDLPPPSCNFCFPLDSLSRHLFPI